MDHQRRAPGDVTGANAIQGKLSASSNTHRADGDRVSTIQPIPRLRLRGRLHWLSRHAHVVALWSASVLLLSVAGLIALRWL